MKDAYTFEVGDSIFLETELLGLDIVNGVELSPNQNANVIYVDSKIAVAHVRCNSKFERDCYLNDVDICNSYSYLDGEYVNQLLGTELECGEFDLFLDAYDTDHLRGLNGHDGLVLYDVDGNQVPYRHIKQKEFIAYCGEQALDKIIYVKLYGNLPVNCRYLPLSKEELAELDLCEDGNYYKVSILTSKEMHLGDFVSIDGIDGEVVYSSRNQVVIPYPTGPHDMNSEMVCAPASISGRKISVEEMVSLPGNICFEEDAYKDYEYWMFDQVTGETEEQFKSLSIKCDDGREFEGDIVGYYYIGRNLFGRFLYFPPEETEKAKRFFDSKRYANTSLMSFLGMPVDKEYISNLYFFEIGDGDSVKILH